MVNFKYLGLPLLLSLLGSRLADAECTFTLSGNSCTATDCSSSGYYIIDENNELIPSSDKVKSGTVIKYDSSESKCEKIITTGFYKAIDLDVYIELKDEKGKYYANSALACNDANVGKMTTEGLCIGYFGGNEPKVVQFPDDSLDKSLEMFVQHKSTSGNLFNWDRENANYYAILVDKDFIIFNEEFEKKDWRATNEGKAISRKAAHCKLDSEVSKKYYDCTAGICQSKDLDKTVYDANGENICNMKYTGSGYQITVEGNCIKPKDGYYFYELPTSTKEAVSEKTALNDKGAYVHISGGTPQIIAPKKNASGSYYYYNKSKSTEQTLPIIHCEGSTCSLSASGPEGKNYFVDAEDNTLIIKNGSKYVNESNASIGYYFNDYSLQEGYICVRNTGETVTTCTSFTKSNNPNKVVYCNANVVGGLRIDNEGYHLCKNGRGDELHFSSTINDVGNFIIDAKIFPGANEGKILIEKKGSKIVLVEESGNCESNGQIIKKDSEFYYCAQSEFLFENDGAEFAVKIGGAYKIVQLTENEVKYKENPSGYYLDRTIKTVSENEDTVVIFCDGTNCNPMDSIYIENNDFFANGELKNTDKSGNILRCTEKGDQVKYKKCEVISVSGGFFTNYKKELISCTSDACTFTPSISTKTGYYLNQFSEISDFEDGEKLKSIIECTEKFGCEAKAPIDKTARGCVTESEEQAEESITCSTIIRFANADPEKVSIIECTMKYDSDSDKSSCIIKAASSHQYFVSEVIDKENEYGKLIKCGEDKCEYGGDSGSYINESVDTRKSIITCEEDGVKCVTVTTGKNYYVDGNLGGINLIDCTGEACKAGVKGSARGVYISGSEDLLFYNGERFELIDKDVITNDAEFACAGQDDTSKAVKRYFINGGSKLNANDNKPLIVLSKECKLKSARRDGEVEQSYSISTSDGVADAIYANSNGNGLEYALIYCTSTSNCNEVTAYVNDWFVDLNSKSLFKCDDSECILDKEMVGTVDEGKTLGFLVDPSSMKVLDDNNVKDTVLIKCSKSNVGEKLITCTKMTNISEQYFVNAKSSDQLIYAKSSSDISILENAIGYFNVNASSNIIKCNDEGCDNYEIPATDCTVGGSDGKLLSSKEFCINNSNAGKKNGKYIAKGFSDIDESYIINYSSENKIVRETPQEGYYLVNSENKIVTTTESSNKLYKCTPTCSEESIGKAIYMNGDVSNTEYPYIKCDATGCTLDNNSSSEYCLFTNKLYSCSNGCNEIDPNSTNACTQVSAKEGLYVPFANDHLIKCTGESTCSKISDLKQTYYVGADSNNSLIQCKSSLNSKICAAVKKDDISDGYYIGHDTTVEILIKCSSKVCQSVTISDGWYVGGDLTNGKIINCQAGKCLTYPKPIEGYYENGSWKNSDSEAISAGKKFIKCTSASCIEVKAPGKGYLINAAYNMGRDIYPIFDSNLLYISFNYDDKSYTEYYSNAEGGKKIIVCTNGNVCSLSEEINAEGWYKLGTENDNKLIGCTGGTNNISCSEYSVDDLSKGYYLNAGKGKKRLFRVGEIIEAIDATPHSFYLYADVTSKKIINCELSNSCVISSTLIGTSKCLDSNGAEFTTQYKNNAICNGSKDGYETLVDDDKVAIIAYTNKIPGFNSLYTSSTKKYYIPMKISSDSVIHEAIDGYIYSNGGLYLCKNDYNGVCEKVDKIESGYYLQYNGEDSIIYVCNDGSCKKFEHKRNNPFSCENTNVIVEEETIKLCTDENAKDLKDLDISYIYALEGNLYYTFPGATGRYVMANVNKYSVIFKDQINEITLPCPDASDNTRSDYYCIRNNDLYQVSNMGDKASLSGNIYIKPDGEKKLKILTGADTNNGLLKYDSNSKLKEVYINVENKFKYKCVIGRTCVEKELSPEEPSGYANNNGVLIEIYSNSTRVVIQNEITDGIYKSNDGFTECKNNYCEKITTGELSLNGDRLQFGSYVSDEEPKLVLKTSVKRDGNANVYELTNVSFTSAAGKRNIFLDQDNHIITNGDNEISHFYSCKSSGCDEIQASSCTNVEKYYINTAQIGKAKNAVVKCYDGKFTFINCSEENGNQIYENAKFTDKNDAIISCTKDSCIETGVSTNGLPYCADTLAGCVRADTNEILMEKQHCIDSNTKVIKVSNGSECSPSIEDIAIFDVSLRKLSDRENSHYGASMYKCNNNKCYRTYGYIVGNSNSNLLKCNSEGCIKEEVNGTSCDVVGAGNVIRDVSSIKLCKSTSSKVAIDNNERVHAISISKDNNFPEILSGNEILIGIKSKVAYILSNNDYILINNDNTIMTTSGSGNLYLCEGENWKCKMVNSPENGYYKSSYSKYAIKCKSGCQISEDNTVSFEKDIYQYYINNELFNKVSVLTKSNGISINKVNFNNYILMNGYKLANKDEIVNLDDGISGLYMCNSKNGSCQQISGDDGWYVSGNRENSLKAIRCENKLCEVKTSLNTDGSKKLGDFVYNESKNIFKIVIKEGNTIKAEELVPGTSYHVKYTNSIDEIVFPNHKNYLVVENNAVIGLGIIDNVSGKGSKFYGLSKCVNSFEKDKYCYKASEKYICKGSSDNTPKCSLPFNGRGVLLFNGDTLVDAQNPPTKGTQMYYCRYEGTTKKCELTTGYYKLESKYYSCSYSGCEEVSNGTTKGLLSGGQLRNDNNNNGSFGSKDVKKYYYISGFNMFPGAEKYESFLVESGDDYMVIYTDAGRYLIDSIGLIITEDSQLLPTENKRRDIVEEFNEVEENNNVEENPTVAEVNLVEEVSDVTEDVEAEFEEVEFVNEINVVNSGANIGSVFRREEVVGNMYVCDGSKCEYIQSTINGYFVNDAAELKNSALIECYTYPESKCIIAEDVMFDTASCADVPAGSMIRSNRTIKENAVTAYPAYKFCLSSTQNPIELKSTTKLNYYVMKLIKGDKFIKIDLTDENIELKKDINIIVKTSAELIEQFEKEGYILMNGNTLVEDVTSSLQSTLYYCKKESYYDGSNKTVLCNQVTNVNNGWYFNQNIFGDRRYIKCINGKCGIALADELDNCVESGSIIYNNNSHKVCVTKNSQFDLSTLNSDNVSLIMNVSSNNVFPGIKTSNVDILVKINNESVRYIEQNSYVVATKKSISERTIVDQDEGEGDLYNCINGLCEHQKKPNAGWYLKSDDEGKYTEIIECNINNDRCKIEKDVTEGFYVSANPEYPLIQCILPGYQREDTFEPLDGAKPVCYERKFTEGYYLSGKDGVELIKCTMEEGCKEMNDVTPGWYINNEYLKDVYYDSIYKKISNRTVYPVLKCTSSKCEANEVEMKSECDTNKGEKSGENGGIIYSYNKYRLCKSKTKVGNKNPEAVDISSITDMDTVSYYVINVEKAEDFPSEQTGNILVQVKKNEVSKDNTDSIYYYTDNTMYKCEYGLCSAVESADGKVYYDGINQILYKYYANKSKWDKYSSEGFVFLNSEDILFTTVEETTDVNKLYNCRKDDTTNNIKCIDMKKDGVFKEGYYFNNNVKSSNYSLGELFKCTESECTVVEELLKCTKTYKNNVCYISYDNEEPGSDEKKINSGELCIDGKNLYLAIDEINTGIEDKENCIQFYPITDTVAKYYINNESNVYSVDKLSANAVLGNEYKYVNGLTSKIFEYGNTQFSGYVKQGDYNENFNKKIIYCVDGVCKADKVVYCTYNFQENSCKPSGNVKSGGVCVSKIGEIYIALEDLSSTGFGKCMKHDESLKSNDIEGGSISNDHSNYEVINGDMYSINSEGIVTITKEGLFMVDNVNRRVSLNGKININDPSLKLYVCNKSGCNLREECGNGSLNEFIFSDEKLYVCDPKTNTIKDAGKVVGYYLNKPWNNLIKCYIDYKLEVQCIKLDETNGMEGYYKDGGNNDMIIKCIREKGVFKCENEKIVECKYEGGECVAEVDLLRNSYCYSNNKMVYVENYIKKGDTGECISSEEDVKFFNHKKSKFMGHNEGYDLIKVSENAIVSIYEEDIGYYILSTSTGMGLESSDDSALNKSRMYKCIKDNCEEVTEPVNGKVYINKASNQRLVEYDGSDKKWNVIDHLCDITSNENQCVVNEEISKGGIIYVIDEIKTAIYYSTVSSFKNEKNNKHYMINPNCKKSKENNSYDELNKDKYHFVSLDVGSATENVDERKLYLFNKDGQSFKLENNEGYYMFKNDYEGDGDYNMSPSTSNKNSTALSELKVLQYSNDVYTDVSEFELMADGYYLNYADNGKNGLYLQKMHIIDKPEEETEETNNTNSRKRSSDNGTPTIKFVNNLCNLVDKNKCVSTQDGVIAKGSACVVKDGENSGLYLAIKQITKSSPGDCIKYDNEDIYHYVKENDVTEFAGEKISKLFMRISSNSINIINENIDTTYNGTLYVVDNDKKLLSSKTPVVATGYLCNENEVDGETVFECNEVGKQNKCYYSNVIGNVVCGTTAGKWNIDNSKYYFWNSNFYGAYVTSNEDENKDLLKEIVGSNVKHDGVYVNQMVNNQTLVKVDVGDGAINEEIRTCDVKSTGKCEIPNSDDKLEKEEVCISNGKLYLVDEIAKEGSEDDDETETYCYSGKKDDVKYRKIDDKLYMLDGESVQIIREGYYVLNKDMKAFSTNYPEEPLVVIKCELMECVEKTKEDYDAINADVILNSANGKLLKFYNDGKFVDIYQPGFYFLSSSNSVTLEEGETYMKYVLMEDGTMINNVKDGLNEVEINGKKYTFVFNKDNIYVNYAKKGTFIKDGSYYEESLLKYDSNKDRISYNGKYNENGNKNVYKLIENSLYKLKQKTLENAEVGLYAIVDDLPFRSKEWTKLSTGNNMICYYDGSQCNNDKLATYKKQKYMLNNAMETISVIEYNSEEDEWRIVDEDGYYFFFEDGYVVNSIDNRIDRVVQIEDGKTYEITGNSRTEGYYIYDGMMIELNSEGWEDGEKLINRVVVNEKGQCSAYEVGVSIENGSLCYNDKQGICIMKSSDNNSSCRFAESGTKNYYLLGEALYEYNNQSYQKVKKSGIYVVNNFGSVFNSKVESGGHAYSCLDGVCGKANDLESQYYLNMANENGDSSIILSYNKNNKRWVKTDVNGYYFFNKLGKPVVEKDEIEYVYLVKDNGNTVMNVKENAIDGTYIDQSNVNEEIVVVRNGSWSNASKVPKCKINKISRVVTSKDILRKGDICLDNKKVIIIKSSKEKRDSENESEYEMITAQNEGVIYYYNDEDLSLSKIENNVITPVDISGYAVIDKLGMEALSSTSNTACEVYKCESKKCEVVSANVLSKTKYYVNGIVEENKLVEYVNNGNCRVVSNQGYYFLNENLAVLGSGNKVGIAFDVDLEQEEMNNLDYIGFFVNKANKDKIIVSSNGNVWSIGETVKKCNATQDENTGNGSICKTLNENDDVISAGSYCYSGDKMYLLTGEASFESVEVNCYSGTNENPIYLYSSDAGFNEFNGVSISGVLVELTDDSIKLADPGYYVIDEYGMIVTNTTENEQPRIYKCSDNACVSAQIEDGESVMLNTGDIYERNSEGELVSVEDEGLYFFNEGASCSTNSNEVTDIVSVRNDGEVLVREIVELGDLEEGIYVNNANKETVGIYEGESLVFKNVACSYNADNGSCNSEIEDLDIGDYCNYEGSIYVVYNVTSDDVKNCIKGGDEKPVLLKIEDSIMIVKEKSIKYANEEGYYALDIENNEGLESEELKSSVFIKCEFGGECKETIPEVGRYINRAVEELNIVNYPTGEVEVASTLNETCIVNDDESCTSTSELVAGDVCISLNSIYLIGDEGKCTKSEKTIVKYQFVNKKLYKLNDDSVIQMLDGYYFIDGDNRSISSKEDYKKKDTRGFICSSINKMGECSLLKPKKLSYFVDNNSILDNKFNVVKFSPSNGKSKRDEDESSGFESVDEEGIYKMDDGRYVECEKDENDEIVCQDITKEGSKLTKDGELISCKENEDGEVVCSQETEGGYYVIDGELMECDINGEEDQLECEKMSKEGYFLANPDDELWECVEKTEEPTATEEPTGDVNVSKVMNELNGNGDGIDSVLEDDNDSDLEDTTTTDSTTTNTTTTTTTTEETTTTTTTTTTSEAVETPIDVVCQRVKCSEKPIYMENDENDEGEPVAMYVCKTIDDEEKWVSENCESGNYVKVDNDYYDCENEKESIPEENIEQPNDEHTVDDDTETTTSSSEITTEESTTDEKTTTTSSSTTTTTTTTTDASETTTKSSEESKTTTTTTTSSSTTTSSVETTTTTASKQTTTTTTTTSSKTTTKSTSTSSNESGAISLIRKIPSLSFYLIIFIFTYALFI